MKMKVSTIILFTSLVLATSCARKENPIPEWPWTDPKEKPDPKPETPPAEKDAKARYIWIDASANFYYYANSKSTIAKELKKLKECGFTDIIVDVRPTEGTVLFDSKKAPKTKRLAAWLKSSYQFINRTETWDYLQAFIDEGHAQGLKVNAAINTFVGGYGGYYGLESEGPIFSGEIPGSWATVQNTEDGLKSSFYPGVQGTVFLNPANDKVQEYMLAIIKELAGYKLDGIILDRCRFDDSSLKSDFSDETKAKFEEYLGKAASRWPVFDKGASELPSVLTEEQKSWLAFRAKVIHDFVEKAAASVHSVNAQMRFGCYVGAWYSSYYFSGVNWASPKYLTHKFYPKWANEDYHNYGYADHCDFMMLGCYAGAKKIYGSGEWTMEGFCKQGKTLLAGDTVFAGGPDIGNARGFENGGCEKIIPNTVDACINNADGYFVFDLCHIRMYDYWDSFKKAFENYLNSLKK